MTVIWRTTVGIKRPVISKQDHIFLMKLSTLLEGNLVLNIPTAFNQTITTTGGNLHFTVNPLLVIIHIDLFVEHSLTTVREI